MKILLVLTIVLSHALFADFCMCIYPEKGHAYGKENETGFYRLGCSVWLNSQKSCRKRKLMTLGSSLAQFVENHTKVGETIKLGYVGHSSIAGMKLYMNEYLAEVIEKTSHSFIIDNTACDGLKNPNTIHNIVRGYSLAPGQFVRVKANQVVSVGVWDKVYPRFRHANLYAVSDSRSQKIEYPSCHKFITRGCSASYQHKETGLCSLDGELKKITCSNKKVESGKIKALSPIHKLLGNAWSPSSI